MKSFILALAVAAWAALAAAETAYVTDQTQVHLRAGEGTQFKILRSLDSGTRLERLTHNPKTGYSKVRLEDGQQGWLLSRYLNDHPGAAARLEKATAELAALQEENRRLRKELESLRTAGSQAASKQQGMSEENARLNRELNTIRHASANAVQIKNERDLLQERVVRLERETERLQRDNQALDDSSDQAWFVRGAAVLFGGIVLGLLLPRLGWRRKAHNWNTF